MRTEVSFPAVDGSPLAAWRYDPGTGAHPMVVLGHGFGGTRHARLDAFAERFAAAGLGVLVFDYRHFGDSGGEPRQLLDIGRQLDDWRSAIAYARSLPEVDATRIGLWGSSFGGGHVVRIASEDPTLGAAIAQVPFASGPATLRAVGAAAAGRLTIAALRDLVAAARRREPFRIPLVGPPGSLAAMTTPDAEAGYRAMIPEDVEFREDVAARIFLRVPTYRPVARARRVACPLLVCVATDDALTPAGAAARVARRAPQGQVRHYPIGHFDVYVAPWFDAVVDDQVTFLRETLRPPRAAA